MQYISEQDLDLASGLKKTCDLHGRNQVTTVWSSLLGHQTDGIRVLVKVHTVVAVPQ